MGTAFTEKVDLNNLESKLLNQQWAPFLSRWAPFRSTKRQEKCYVSFESTVTQACKPMARSDLTVLATRLDQIMNQLDKILDDSDSKVL